MARRIFAHHVGQHAVVAHEEVALGLQDLVEAPGDQREVHIVEVGCGDGVDVVVDVGVVRVARVAIPVFEEEVHGVEQDELVEIENVRGSGDAVGFEMVDRESEVGLVVELRQIFDADEIETLVDEVVGVLDLVEVAVAVGEVTLDVARHHRFDADKHARCGSGRDALPDRLAVHQHPHDVASGVGEAGELEQFVAHHLPGE